MSQENTKKSANIHGDMNDYIATITLSNPSKFNALPQNCWEAIPSLIQQLVNNNARVIILTGEGKNFCAGADISEFDVVRKNAETAIIYEQTNINAFKALRDCPIPTIAKVKGYCLGGGFGLVAACDLRIAHKQAMFAVPAAKLGLAYPVEAMADIVHAIGAQNTSKLMFTGAKFSTAEIHAFGFLSAVTDDLDDYVENLAREIATLAPLTHRATKSAIAAVLDANKGANIETAIQQANATFNSADYNEGREAFRQKRSAKFQGY